MARGGLCGVCLPNHLIGAWEGEERKPGERDHASRPDLLCAEPDSYHALGRGMDEDGECVEEDRDLLGIQDFF